MAQQKSNSALVTQKEQEFFAEGIQFECQGSGKCCVSRGQYGYVYLTLEDRRQLAKQLELSTQKFTSQFCNKTDGFYYLKSTDVDGTEVKECIFLKNNQCSVYAGRPTQCRTWPFWPELMNARAWKKEVVQFCPGVDKGKKWSKEQIAALVAEQKKSEMELEKEA